MKEVHQNIIESLNLSKSDMTIKMHSLHWDIFDSAFSNNLNNFDSLSNFRSSGLSKFLDDSNEIHGELKIKIFFKDLINDVNFNFFQTVAESKIGNPKTIQIDQFNIDYNDLFLVYYAWQISKYIKNEKSLVLEIGAGYGGLGLKLKKLYPQITVIYFDLPEVNAIQNFYLKSASKDYKIFNYKDYIESKIDIFDSEFLSNFDFVILPGWQIEKIQNNIIDVIINTRSMMEMDLSIIDFYFQNIHRIIKLDGFFYCNNRYEKSTVGYPVRIKDYPFDSNWYLTISEPSWKQPAIHVLGCIRTNYVVLNSINNGLNEIKPFAIIDVKYFFHKLIVLKMKLLSLILKYFKYQQFRESKILKNNL